MTPPGLAKRLQQNPHESDVLSLPREAVREIHDEVSRLRQSSDRLRKQNNKMRRRIEKLKNGEADPGETDNETSAD